MVSGTKYTNERMDSVLVLRTCDKMLQWYKFAREDLIKAFNSLETNYRPQDG